MHKEKDIYLYSLLQKRNGIETHAVELGLNAELNEDGEWDGDFIFNDSFDYIEQMTDFINEIIDAQEREICHIRLCS
jgi:hypothetical protein